MVSTPYKKRYRRKHDPYNAMGEAEIRPSNIPKQQLSDAEKTATRIFLSIMIFLLLILTQI